MGWLLANGFLMLVVLVAAGYVWLAFFLLKLASLHESPIILLAAFSAALIATYFTMKGAHAVLAKRV